MSDGREFYFSNKIIHVLLNRQRPVNPDHMSRATSSKPYAGSGNTEVHTGFYVSGIELESG